MCPSPLEFESSPTKTLMDMIYSGNDDNVRRVRCSIVETESVGERQEFDLLGEYAPPTCIILSAGTAVGMNPTCIENHGWISGDVLRLLPTSKGRFVCPL